MKRILFIIGLLMVFFPALQAQENKTLEMAHAAFRQHDYVDAVRYYKKVLRKTNNFESQKELAFQLGLCYYKMKSYDAAKHWLEDAVGNHIDRMEAYLYLSDILMIEKRYQQAVSILQKAKSYVKNSSRIDKRISHIHFIQRNILAKHSPVIRRLAALNSTTSDYGLAWWGKKLVFASTRQPKLSRSLDGRTGQGFSKLYYAKKQSGTNQWSVNRMPQAFNTGYNDGTFTFDSIHNTAYWTSCSEHSRHCLILRSRYSSEKERWLRPEKVNFMISGYNYGHPNLSADATTLYFVSNMPGGYGQNDIWRISRTEGDNWGIPVNLGPEINTSENELFPQIVGDSLLFFASDRPGGLGGLDIYYSLKRHLDFSPAKPLPYPMNSPADDFSLLMNPSGRGGYLCSNRQVKSSDDIYQFDGFPVKVLVEGRIVEKFDGKPISHVMVLFKNASGRSDTVYSSLSGDYQFLLNAMDDYLISTKKPGYFEEKRTLSTLSHSLINNQGVVKHLNFYLEKKNYPCSIQGWVKERDKQKPMAGLKVMISSANGFSSYVLTNTKGLYRFDGLKPNTMYTIKTGHRGFFSESRVCSLPKVHQSMVFSKANGYDMDFDLTPIQTKSEVILSNIYYDFDKASLRASSKIELNKLASMLRETPGVVIQINAHTDSRGTAAYNLKLSKARAQAVVDYLVSQGINRKRLVAKGWGEAKPLIYNARTDDEFQANRRTSFKILSLLPAYPTSDGIKLANTQQPKQNPVHKKTEVKPELSVPVVSKALVYRVQILSSSKWISTKYGFAKLKQHLPHVRVYRISITSRFYRYEIGDRYHLSEAKLLQSQLRKLGYKDCFVVAYNHGRKISTKVAYQKEKGGRR